MDTALEPIILKNSKKIESKLALFNMSNYMMSKNSQNKMSSTQSNNVSRKKLRKQKKRQKQKEKRRQKREELKKEQNTHFKLKCSGKAAEKTAIAIPEKHGKNVIVAVYGEDESGKYNAVKYTTNNNKNCKYSRDKLITWNGRLTDTDKNVVSSPAHLLLHQRAEGKSKRDFKSEKISNHFEFYNCACGISSGKLYTPSHYKLWMRIHKKTCKLEK